MGVLNKIRKQNFILIVLITLGIFGFLFNFEELLNLFQPNPNIYGKINKINISKQDFEIFRNIIEKENLENESFDEEIWKYLIDSKLIVDRFNKSGLQLTKDNFWIFISCPTISYKKKNNIYNKQIPNFYTLKRDIEIIKNKSKFDKNSETIYKNWLQEKKILEYEIKKNLYFSTILKGLLTNKTETNFFNKIKGNININFALIDYNKYYKQKMNNISDQDIQKYINNHPNKFQKEPSVGFKYILFHNKPSVKDSIITYNNILTHLKGGNLLDENGNIMDEVKSFKNLKNNELENYINYYSDKKFESYYLPQKKQPGPIKNLLNKASINEIFGPYITKDSYVLSKLINIKKIDSISSRHILISYKDVLSNISRSKKEAKIIANNLLIRIRHDINNFDKFLFLSDDKFSIKNKGKLKSTITENKDFISEIQDFLEKSKKGSVDLVETKFGYHIIHILNKKNLDTYYNVVHLVKNKKCSEETIKNIYNQVLNFNELIKNKSEIYFISLANKNKLKINDIKRITNTNLNFKNLNLSYQDKKEILNWLFDSKRKILDTSIFRLSSQDYIIIILTNINFKGIINPKIIRPEIEVFLKKKKISNFLIKKLKNSKKNLNELAKEFNIIIKSSLINFQNLKVPGVGLEPNVVGAIFGIKKNNSLNVIRGEKGIFLINIKNNRKENSFLKKNIENININELYPYLIISSLKNKAIIEDFRLKIENNTK